MQQVLNHNQGSYFLERHLDRRRFWQQSALALITSTLAVMARRANFAYAQSGNADLDILNYALTLEHLESRAYQSVANIGLVTGRARDYFVNFGDEEAAHVVALTGTIIKLGGTPVRAQEHYNMPNFQTEMDVLTFFQMMEELGAAAYLGQAPNIQDKSLLTVAVSIHNVEGQHAAMLNDLVGQPPSPAFAPAKSLEEVLPLVTPLLSNVPTALPQTGRGGAVPVQHHRPQVLAE